MRDIKRMSFGSLTGTDVRQKQRNEVKSNRTHRRTESKDYSFFPPHTVPELRVKCREDTSGWGGR